jgi:hypothetical protein
MSIKWHPFIHYCFNVDKLMEGTKNVSQFNRKLRKQSHERPNDWDPDKYYGDGGELFFQYLIHRLGDHPGIGIQQYQPVLGNEDLGVDGFGYDGDGEVATVQVKMRSNTTELLTANNDKLMNFVAHSLTKFSGDGKVKKMILFTTADDAHHRTKEMWDHKVQVFGRKQIDALTKDNLIFWNGLRDLLKYKKDTRYTPEV